MHDKRTISKSTIIRLATTAAVFMFAIFLFTHNKADVDLWGNVGFVKHLPSSVDFHRTNTFSFTEPNYIWVNHEWLAEYILNKTHSILGNPGLLLLKALLGFTLLGIIYRSMLNSCNSAASRVIYLLLIISTLGYGFSTRPHLFTYILVAVLLSWLLQIMNSSQASKSRPLTQPRGYALVVIAAPLGCLWANLHGAFFIGQILFLLAFIYSLIKRIMGFDKSWRITLLMSVASIAFFCGTLLNPYGINLWDFVFESAGIVRPILSEWAPFNPLTNFSDHVDFIVLVAITIISIAVSFRSCSGFGVLVLALSLIAAFGMRRNIPLFAIVTGIVSTGCIGKSFGNEIDNIFKKLNHHLVIILLLCSTAISALFFVNANRNHPLEIIIPRNQFPV